MARSMISDTLTAACADFASLKEMLPFDTTIGSAERVALTHALWCPTCKPIAHTMRKAQVADADRIADQARAETAAAAADVLNKAAKIIETNGFHKNYLWDTAQASAGTPLEDCRVGIIGAVAIVLFGNPRYASSPRVWAVEQVLTDRIDAPSLVAWCSYPGHGKTAAVALLRSTADALWADA